MAAVGAMAGSATLPVLPRRTVNQGSTQCCVSCALGAAMEALHGDWDALSPMFHYHVTRFVRGRGDAQGHLSFEDGFETLTTHGICREADHASVFDDRGIAARPSSAAFADAASRVVGLNGLFFPVEEIASTSRAADIRTHIRSGHPVVILFNLPMGYPKTFPTASDDWIDPGTPPASGSSHCVLIVGFNDLRGGGSVRGAVQVFDSQGTNAFDKGLWWMGYRVLDSSVVLRAYALI